MKKIKIILVSSAIFLAIGGAMASKCALCEYYVQYRDFNGVYMQAGTLGINYYCSDEINTCTYYKPHPTSNYVPCQWGTYVPIY
ncbi:MAG TPA: DUF6520 family protein [Niastella sp.]